MTNEENVNDRVYTVVVNHEEQYSIWLADQSVPAGWREVGVCGSRQECLDHIREVWTDMRPLSLRRQMEANQPCRMVREGDSRTGHLQARGGDLGEAPTIRERQL